MDGKRHAHIGDGCRDCPGPEERLTPEQAIRNAQPGPDGIFHISHTEPETMKIYDAMELARYPRQWTPTTEGNEAYWGMGIIQDWQPTKQLYLQKQVYGG